MKKFLAVEAIPLYLLLLFTFLGGLNPLGAVPQTPTPPRAEELFEAIESGNIALSKTLIDRGAPLNALRVRPIKSWAGFTSRPQGPWAYTGRITPLVQAIALDHLAIVRYLLAKGADPNIYVTMEGMVPNVSGQLEPSGMWESNALFTALERGDPRMLKALLDAKADPMLLVRYYGGPRPPVQREALDTTRFGAVYWRDSRARISLLDLLLVKGFSSATLWNMVKAKAPSLEPRTFLVDGIFYATMSNDPELLAKCLNRGDALDAESLAAMVRGAKVSLLNVLADHGYQGLPRQDLWLDIGRLAQTLDGFWLQKILGIYESHTDWTGTLRTDFLTRIAPGTNQILPIQEALEGSKTLFASLGHPATMSQLPFPVALLMDPWLRPWKLTSPQDPLAYTTDTTSPPRTLAATAYATALATTIQGLWSNGLANNWRLDIRPDRIRNVGNDDLGRPFDVTYTPWRLSLEDGGLGTNGEGIQVRIGREDRPWFRISLGSEGIIIRDTVDNSSVPMSRQAGVAQAR